MNDTKPFGVEITLSDVCKNITYGLQAQEHCIGDPQEAPK